MKKFSLSQAFTCYGCGQHFTSVRSLGSHARYSKTCTLEMRFWGKIDKRGPDECWPWKGARRWDGYGRVTFIQKQTTANRVVYELTHGVTLETEQHVLHKCDNPPCCNPRHLFLGDHKTNMRDRAAKGRTYLGGSRRAIPTR